MERGGDENITFSFLVIGRHTSKWSLTDWKYLPTEEHVLAASPTGPTDASPNGGITIFWLHPNCSIWDAEPDTFEIIYRNQKCGFYSPCCFSTTSPHHRGGQAWQWALSPALPSHRFSKSPPLHNTLCTQGRRAELAPVPVPTLAATAADSCITLLAAFGCRRAGSKKDFF